MVHITCGNKTPKIPQSGCSDCEQLEERVEALEQCCEDVHTALDEKADETEITEIMHIINGLAAGWHYIGDIDGVENLPTSVSAGEAFYDTTTGSWYIAKEDIPSGATQSDFLFVSGNDYTLHTDTVNGDAVLQLQDSHNNTSNVPVVGEGAVNVEDTGDELTISVENATTEQAGLMSPEDKDKLDNIDDIYDETCGDPAEFEGQGGANLKSVQVALEPHQAGTPWQDSTLYKTPFLFRKVLSVNHSINSRYTTLVGADVAVNQLCEHGNFDALTGWTGTRGTLTASGGIASLTVNETSASTVVSRVYRAINFIENHKYLVLYSIKVPRASAISSEATPSAWLGTHNEVQATANVWTEYAKIKVCVGSGSCSFGVGVNNTAGAGYQSSDVIQFRDVQCIDLTQMFGTAIADTAYTKEQATVGSGIAWLKANGFDFSKYRAYDAGSLEAVNPSAIVTRGFNQWDGETESGYIYNGNNYASNDYWRTKNYIRVIAGETYFFNVPSRNGQINMFDANKTYIGAVDQMGQGNPVTLPSNCYYVKFYQPSSASADTVCVNISKPTGTPKNGDYRQYSEHEYALGNVPLHGVFKEENGNIVAYGDTRTSDGTDTHNFGQIDLGTLTWYKLSAGGVTYFQSDSLKSTIKPPTDDTTVPDCVCSAPFVFVSWYSGTTANYIASVAGATDAEAGRLSFQYTGASTAEEFKTAMSGVYMSYPLATPTTDTADPFASPQVVDADGTEEFVTSNDVPVGNQTRYADVYEITGTDTVDTHVHGKNLLHTTATSKTESGLTWTVNEDGTITVTGTATGYTSLNVGKAYVSGLRDKVTISGADYSENIIWSYMSVYDKNDVEIYNITTGSAVAKFTVDLSNYPTADYISVWVKRNSNIATNVTLKLQVEIGDTPTEFEPYAGDDTTTDLTQTVYEGTVDAVSGKLTVTSAHIDPSTLTWTYNSTAGCFVATVSGIKYKAFGVDSGLKSSAYQIKPVGYNESYGTENGVMWQYANTSGIRARNSTYTNADEFKTSLAGSQLVYELATPIEIDLTPTEIEALLGDNYVWSEQGRVCVTFMRDRGELSETLAELQECCDSCGSSECESDLVVFQHISADAYNMYPLDSLLPGDDVLYKITVNGVSQIIESAIYDGDAWLWMYRGDNNSELSFFYDDDNGWSVLTDAGEYDIKIETVCNQPLYVNLSASPLDSTQEIVMDKTFQEIEDAYKLGKTVIVRYSNYQHYTPLQVCYDPYTGFFVSIHGYDKATSTFDIFTFLAVFDNDYPTYLLPV